MKVAGHEERLQRRRHALVARSALLRAEVGAATLDMLPVVDKVERGLRLAAWARNNAAAIGGAAGVIALVMKLRRGRRAKTAVAATAGVGAGLGLAGVLRLALRGWSIWRTVQRLRAARAGYPV
ncbi:hypothetical protein [Uliginosibacterium sp. H1]|uniref:hypothetical protein n=1 Tax=Uliginosibacterium sp. H1 TaxID=3114757 RepID=UPI002E173D56|nr:hypothetical protein [Uliginosibacterium sp. H1]